LEGKIFFLISNLNLLSFSFTTDKVWTHPFNLKQAIPPSGHLEKFLFTTSSGNRKLVAEGDQGLLPIREAQTETAAFPAC